MGPGILSGRSSCSVDRSDFDRLREEKWEERNGADGDVSDCV